MLRFGYQYQDSGAERDLRKRRRLLGQLQNACPHIVAMDPAQAEPGHTAMEVKYAFETYVGTLDYFCMFCRASMVGACGSGVSRPHGSGVPQRSQRHAIGHRQIQTGGRQAGAETQSAWRRALRSASRIDSGGL